MIQVSTSSRSQLVVSYSHALAVMMCMSTTVELEMADGYPQPLSTCAASSFTICQHVWHHVIGVMQSSINLQESHWPMSDVVYGCNWAT